MKPKTAIIILLAITGLVLIFHMLVLFRLIPYENVWGGRLTTDAEMYRFEAVSVAINLFLAWVLLAKGRFIKPFLSDKGLHVILWTFIGLFLLNTVGNVLAESTFEKYFAFLTVTIAFLLWVVVRGEKGVKKKPE